MTLTKHIHHQCVRGGSKVATRLGDDNCIMKLRLQDGTNYRRNGLKHGTLTITISVITMNIEAGIARVASTNV